jgi:hypothetical protein
MGAEGIGRPAVESVKDGMMGWEYESGERTKSGGRRRRRRRHTIRRPALTLAIIAVIISSQKWLVDINRVRDSFAEAVAGESHFGQIS